MEYKVQQRVIYSLVALGLIISIYLTIVHFYSNTLVCPSTGLINCESVLTSPYSEILGIPVAILGLVLFVLAIFMLPKKNDTMVFLWSIAGVGAVLYSIATQTIIGEICIYCLSLDVVILATIYLSNKKQKHT
ncbi:MAG: vitamin K epoxide reductase family protein [Candidatus Micrarchaeales archaeon]